MSGLRSLAMVCALGLLVAVLLLLIVPALATNGDLGINSGANSQNALTEVADSVPTEAPSPTPNATFQAQQQAKQGNATPAPTNTSVPAATATPVA